MSVTSSGAGARLDIGKVVSETFGVMQRNLRLFGLSGLLLIALPGLVNGLLRIAIRSATALSVASILLSIVALVLTLSFQGAVFYATDRDLNSESAELNDCLRAGIRSALPLFGLALLVFIPAYLGMLLLIVPGVLLFLRWSVAGPVLAIENLGILKSMGRSAALTKGRRGAIFLLYLVIAIVAVVLELTVVQMLGGFSGLAAFATTTAVTPVILALIVIVGPILGIVFGALAAALSATLFYQLRLTREGAPFDTVSEVFA